MICELEGVNNRDDVEDLVVFLDCELGVNYDETELALYLALEMETDVIPGTWYWYWYFC